MHLSPANVFARPFDLLGVDALVADLTGSSSDVKSITSLFEDDAAALAVGLDAGLAAGLGIELTGGLGNVIGTLGDFIICNLT